MSTFWDCGVCEFRNSNITAVCRACFNIKTPVTEEKKEEIDDSLFKFGVGDCELRYNVLSDDLSDNAFSRLKNEVTWHEMRHKGGLVPRLVANQGILYSTNNNMQFEPIYRHPATQQPKLIPFTPFVNKIRQICEKYANHTLNHALIQYYRNGHDYISDHSDKTIDIDPDSKIVGFSVGATRLMILKKKKETKMDINMTNIENNQRIRLLNNSVFTLGLQTNRFLYHTIKRDHRENFLKRKDELLCNGQRISITFRKISTFRSRSKPQNILIGQGAKFPNSNAIINVLHNEKKIIFERQKVNFEHVSNWQQQNEFKRMIYAFGDENRKAASFDWEETYGKGFSLVL